MADVATYEIRRVPPKLTYPLRQQVLRPHQTVDSIGSGDDRLTPAFAALSPAGAVLGTVSVRRETAPWRPDRVDAWRVRGMATAPECRRQGIGAALLAHVIDHVSAHGGGFVWCAARVPARSLYERAGFRIYGDEWDDPRIGRHVRMCREIG